MSHTSTILPAIPIRLRSLTSHLPQLSAGCHGSPTLLPLSPSVNPTGSKTALLAGLSIDPHRPCRLPGNLALSPVTQVLQVNKMPFLAINLYPVCIPPSINDLPLCFASGNGRVFIRFECQFPIVFSQGCSASSLSTQLCSACTLVPHFKVRRSTAGSLSQPSVTFLSNDTCRYAVIRTSTAEAGSVGVGTSVGARGPRCQECDIK